MQVLKIFNREEREEREAGAEKIFAFFAVIILVAALPR